MKSPKDMKIIQIDITNACNKICSNCTRFCGLFNKPFFMDFETFKQAVDSLKEFNGIVGIMGGEPTLHPEFDKFVTYLHSKRPEYRKYSGVRYPVDSFKYYAKKLIYRNGKRCGLWSAFGDGYYKYFELIQDVFGYQALNDHIDKNNHQAILIPRKELGINDEEFLKRRDNCWLQNLWSASITPKGAFYCEIAAAMDMLFDGPGGWKIEPNWWKRTPDDFKDQIHWCENCSMSLDVPSIDSKQQTDLISKGMLDKLKQINGWKIQNGKYEIFGPDDYLKQKTIHKRISHWFLEKGEKKRVSDVTDFSLYPKKIDVALIEGSDEMVTISKKDVENLKFTDFLIVFPNEKLIDKNIINKMRQCILNPGFYYDLGNGIFIINSRAIALKKVKSIIIHDNLYKLWPKNKFLKVNSKKLGKLTLLQKVYEFLGVLFNRTAFLLPK